VHNLPEERRKERRGVGGNPGRSDRQRLNAVFCVRKRIYKIIRIIGCGKVIIGYDAATRQVSSTSLRENREMEFFAAQFAIR
jgi:hypothetical protein